MKLSDLIDVLKDLLKDNGDMDIADVFFNDRGDELVLEDSSLDWKLRKYIQFIENEDD